MDKTAAQLVDFTAGLRYSDIPASTVKAAKGRLLDSMGCAMAALLAPPVRAARKLAYPVAGTGGARIFGTLTRTTPDLAALVNGAMVRYLDMSDAYLMTSTAHPSDNIPGLIAIAEETGASGNDLIQAIVVSYEVQCRLCQAAPFQTAGWDQPVAGAPGAAMAAGRLLGLDKDRLRDALALAVVPNLASNQTRNGQLSMWKGVAGPNAARQGVFAAQLAAAGMTGPQDPFDGPVGLWNQTVGKHHRVQIPKRLKGHKFIIEQTNIKTFPVRDAIQVPIMAALKLREKVDIADIAELRIDTYAKHFAGPMKDKALWTPKTRESADHSLPFCVAAALLDGAVTPATFETGRFLDKDVLALIKRLKITLNGDFEKVAPATRTCRLIATTKDGREFAVQHRQTMRDIERGPSKQAFEDKFHLLASASLPEDARGEMIDLIWSIDKAKSVDRLVDLTEI